MAKGIVVICFPKTYKRESHPCVCVWVCIYVCRHRLTDTHPHTYRHMNVSGEKKPLGLSQDLLCNTHLGMRSVVDVPLGLPSLLSHLPFYLLFGYVLFHSGIYYLFLFGAERESIYLASWTYISHNEGNKAGAKYLIYYSLPCRGVISLRTRRDFQGRRWGWGKRFKKYFHFWRQLWKEISEVFSLF